jgi:hypothetical protein
MDYEHAQEFEDDGFLDEENPPAAFSSHHDENTEEIDHSPVKKASILSHLNRKPLPTRLNSAEESSPVGSMDLKGMATILSEDREKIMNEFVQFHRSFIRESSEATKAETQLLVELSMNMGKRSGDPGAFQRYCRELDEQLKEKLNKIVQLRSRLRNHIENE